MRSVIGFLALVILCGFVATIQAEVIQTVHYPVTTTITFDGDDSDWLGGKYTSDGLWDTSKDLTGINRSDMEYVRLGHDDTYLYGFFKFNIDRNFNNSSTASESAMAFDMDKNRATGITYGPALGAEHWISSIRASGTTLDYRDGSGNHTGPVINGMAGGGIFYTANTVSGRYVQVEWRIPWTRINTSPPTIDGFYWVWSAWRSGDVYPDEFFDEGYFEYSLVPEPSTFALLSCGLIGLLAYAWRKRK